MSSGSTTAAIPGEQELKDCLKDAGLYEENMSHGEMMNCYNAIKSSKSTAQEEDEQRCILETTDENCRLLEELKEKNANLTISKLPPSSASKKKGGDIEEDAIMTVVSVLTKAADETIATAVTEKKVTDEKEEEEEEEDEEEGGEEEVEEGGGGREKVFWDFFNCPPLKHKPLDIVSHKPKYDLPVHCDPEVLKLPFEIRTKFIFNFHRSLLDTFYKLHRDSLNQAPWGRPIQEDLKFNNSSLDRKTAMVTEEHKFDEVLTVQAGNSEQSASTEIYTSRAGRQTKRKVYAENEDEKLKKSKREEDNDFQVHSKLPVKRPTISKLSNAEIMKRSKLFADSPKASRSDVLFNQLVEEDRKRKQTQKIMDGFRSTLPMGSDDEEEHNSQEVAEEAEIKPQQVMMLLRRKGSSSVQGRKPIKKSTLLERGRGRIPKTNSNQSKSQESPPDDSPEFFLLDEAAAWGEERAKCPICSEVFSQDIIEEHASSCGLGMDTESNFENVPRNNQEMLKCSICNKDVPMNLNYDVHVKNCIARTAVGKL